MTATPSIKEVTEFIETLEDDFKDILKGEEFKDLGSNSSRSKIAKELNKKGWINGTQMVRANNFFKGLFHKKEDDYKAGVDDDDDLRTTRATRSKPVSRSIKAKEHHTYNKFPVVGYNLKEKAKKLLNFADPGIDSTEFERLPKLYLRNEKPVSYDDYTKAREKYLDAIDKFKKSMKGKKLIYDFEIFKRKPKYNVYEYTLKHVSGDKKDRKQKDTVVLKDESITKVFDSFYKTVDDMKISKTLTKAEIMDLMKSDLIHTIETLDYSTYSKNKELRILITDFLKEECDFALGIFGGSQTIDIDDTFKNFEESVKPEDKKGYIKLLDQISFDKPLSLTSLAVKIFDNRNGITNHAKLTAKMKKDMWLTALTNVANIEKPTEHQKLWKHILESRFMFNIFMNGAVPSKWVHTGLITMLKNTETIKMAMNELYPISFTFTPFMCGSDKAEYDDEFKASKLNKTIKEYFTSILTDDNESHKYNDCAWIYYVLKDSGKTELNNKTVALLEYVVVNLKARGSKDKETDSKKDDSTDSADSNKSDDSADDSDNKSVSKTKPSKFTPKSKQYDIASSDSESEKKPKPKSKIGGRKVSKKPTDDSDDEYTAPDDDSASSASSD